MQGSFASVREQETGRGRVDANPGSAVLLLKPGEKVPIPIPIPKPRSRDFSKDYLAESSKVTAYSKPSRRTSGTPSILLPAPTASSFSSSSLPSLPSHRKASRQQPASGSYRYQNHPRRVALSPNPPSRSAGASLFNELSQIEEESATGGRIQDEQETGKGRFSSAFDPVLSVEKEIVLRRMRRERYSVCGGSRRSSAVADLADFDETKSLDFGRGRRASFRLDLNGNASCDYFDRTKHASPSPVADRSTWAKIQSSINDSNCEKSIDSGTFTGSDAATSDKNAVQETVGGQKESKRKWIAELSRLFSLSNSKGLSFRKKDTSTQNKAREEKLDAGGENKQNIKHAGLNGDNCLLQTNEEKSNNTHLSGIKEEDSFLKGACQESESEIRSEKVQDEVIPAGKVNIPEVCLESHSSTPSSPPIAEQHSTGDLQSLPHTIPQSPITTQKQRLIWQQLRRHTFGRVKGFVANRSDQFEANPILTPNHRLKSVSTPSTPRPSSVRGPPPPSACPTPRGPPSKRAATPRPDLVSSGGRLFPSPVASQPIAIPQQARSISMTSVVQPPSMLSHTEDESDIRLLCQDSDWRTRVWVEVLPLPEPDATDFSADVSNVSKDSVTPPPAAPSVTLQLVHECKPTCNFQSDLSGAASVQGPVSVSTYGDDLHKVLWYRFLGR